MGMSSDGLLFYGYIYEDEGSVFGYNEDEEDSDDEWDKIIAGRRGITNPWDNFPTEEADKIRDYKERQKFIDAWCDSVDLKSWHAALKSIKEEFGCDIGWMGHLEYSYPCIFVNESQKKAYDYSVQNVTELLTSPSPLAEWNAKLEHFITELGLEPSEGPGWYLTSTYG